MSHRRAQPAVDFQGQRVLVTGGTGFLGSHLVRELLDRGAAVHVLSRRPSQPSRIDDIRSRVRLIQGDIRIRRDVRHAVEASEPQTIFHLAAYGVDPRMRDPATIIKTNVLGMSHLLEASVDVPYERLVNTGTCFEYGQHKSKIAETVALEPLNVYAASKLAAGHLCDLHRRSQGKPIVTIRPFTFFGPHESRHRLIPSVIVSVLEGRAIRITSGLQTRDYTYVADMVDAFLRAALARPAVGEYINVGSGEDLPVRDIVKRIRDLMRSDVPIEVGAVQTRKDETWRLCCDNAKAHTLLGWQPRLTFDEGLARTIEWFRAQRDGAARSRGRREASR